MRITLIPTLSIFVVSVFVTSILAVNKMTDDFEDVLHTESVYLGSRVRDILLRNVDRLRLLASSPVVRHEPLDVVLEYLRSEEERLHSEVEGLYYNTLEGEVTGARGQSFSVADREYYWGNDPGKSIFTGMLVSRGSDEFTFLALEPIRVDDGYRGYLGLTIDLARLKEVVWDDYRPGSLLLVDLNQKAFSLESRAFVGQPTRFSEMLQMPPEAIVDAELNGESLAFKKVTLSPFNVDLLIGRERPTLYQSLTLWNLGLAVFLALMAALLTRLTLHNAREIYDPLAHLTQVFRDFAAGRTLMAPRKDGVLELIELQESFYKMAAKVTEQQERQVILEEEKRQLLIRQKDAERNAEIGRFSATILHDLNNLFAIIKGAASFLGRDQMRLEDVAAAIHKASDRGKELAKHVLFFASGSQPDLRRIDVVPIVYETVESASLLKQPTVAIGVECFVAMAFAQADEEMVLQAVLNLLKNALDASDSRILVTVGIDSCSNTGTVVIAVHDDGPGINPEDRHHIFEPFATSKPRHLGTGLGLAVVRQVAERLGGHVEVKQSELLGGACFTLAIPSSSGPPVVLD